MNQVRQFRRIAHVTLMLGLAALIILTSSSPTLPCETDEWEGGKMTKWVNPDVENNMVTITVEYDKKDAEAGKLIRFIEMIGPKNSAYSDRILIGGGHKKIGAGAASGKVVWKVTKDDIPNMRQGVISGCFSCHDENNMPALDEWPNGAAFNPVTEQEFKDWVKNMRHNGYEQYIDINPQDPGDENSDMGFKTKCFQTAESAQSDWRDYFYFGHYNRGPSGFYYLEARQADIPPGWDFFTNPPLGQPYFLPAEGFLYGQITIVPHGTVAEGEQARVTLCAIDQDTGECPETFTVRSVKDTTAPVVLDGPIATLHGGPPDSTIRVTLTAQDFPATVASAKIFYVLNGGPASSAFMDIATSTVDPVGFETEIGPLDVGTNTLTYSVVVRDELGNQTQTAPQTDEFIVGPCDAYDDGSTEDAIGFTAGGHLAWMHRQGTIGGFTVVSSISTAYGTAAFPGSGPANGTASQIAIWDDPNDDGDPIDAVLLQLINTTVSNTDTDILNVTNLNPPVGVSGFYFIGAGLAHPSGIFPAPWDNDNGASAGRAWIVGDQPGPLDYNNLGANSFPPDDIDTIGLPGLWLLEAQCQPFLVQSVCDGSVGCPCGNNGAPGNGCANQSFPGGANMAATGNALMGGDSLMLNVTDQHPGSLTLFWQGSTGIAPVFAGDGLRCFSGLKRLFLVFNAFSSSVSAPSPASVPPTPATVTGQSAAVGDPLSPGSVRGYFAFFRSPSPTFCPNPPGNTFNSTNAVRVIWGQ